MPRSNQTKRLLAQSLMDLMTTTPLEKISVNDIVDHAVWGSALQPGHSVPLQLHIGE